ncbi:MAG: hypothetical protein AAGF11_14660 [Myxococcota bacterium]
MMTKTGAPTGARGARARRPIILATILAITGVVATGCTAQDDELFPFPSLQHDLDTVERWEPILHSDRWTLSTADQDPLPQHRRRAEVLCGTPDVQVEGAAFEISTAECNYASLTQPALRGVEAGAWLEVPIWWQTLLADEPAEAHLALLVGPELVWEEVVEIPGPADVRDLQVLSPLTFAAGTPITFHVHNHGTNTWFIGTMYGEAES